MPCAYLLYLTHVTPSVATDIRCTSVSDGLSAFSRARRRCSAQYLSEKACDTLQCCTCRHCSMMCSTEKHSLTSRRLTVCRTCAQIQLFSTCRARAHNYDGLVSARSAVAAVRSYLRTKLLLRVYVLTRAHQLRISTLNMQDLSLIHI